MTAALADQRWRIVAGLIRLTGDWELAEDCLSDAAESALTHWPRDGIPRNPAAWLTTAARHRALDLLRRRHTETAKLREITVSQQLPPSDSEVDPFGDVYLDDELRLIFTCCHPALPLAGRVALTLRTVTGMSMRDIATAFLTSESTMGQRLLRTRARIAQTGIAFRVPAPHRLAERTAGVLAVVYLIFNQGFSEPGDRPQLAGTAVRLAEELHRLLPEDAEVAGLLALLLLQHARRGSRVDAEDDLVPIEEQDRTRWDGAAVRAALDLLRNSASGAGRYRWEARIAALHIVAPSAASTDWAAVVAGYDALLAVHPSPVVALNRVVALSFRDGPAAGLAVLADMDGAAGDPELAGTAMLAAVRADLLRRAGRFADAAPAYREAIRRLEPGAQQRFLHRRLAEVLTGLSAPPS